MRPVDLSPISAGEQTQRPIDLFLIFVGANIVATTLQVGASLPATFSLPTALTVIAVGAIGGALLTAALAPIGTRLRVPSIVASRAALGLSGAQTLALLLFVTNFAWIALNNVIAASITARLTNLGTPAGWAVGLGLAATLIVLGGPRAAALVDRVAVPILLLSGAVFTVACWRAPTPSWPDGPAPAADIVRGLDIVAGYQVSWLLMFADYPRYVRSARAAGIAVFAGLALTALWFMPLGLVAAALAHSPDPGDMVYSLGLGWWGATLLALAALTTNFVNIYMSALALKSLRPALGDSVVIWVIGGVGAALGLMSTAWLEQFASFTLALAVDWCRSAASCSPTTSCCGAPWRSRTCMTHLAGTPGIAAGRSPAFRRGSSALRCSMRLAASGRPCPALPRRSWCTPRSPGRSNASR